MGAYRRLQPLLRQGKTIELKQAYTGVYAVALDGINEDASLPSEFALTKGLKTPPKGKLFGLPPSPNLRARQRKGKLRSGGKSSQLRRCH